MLQVNARQVSDTSTLTNVTVYDELPRLFFFYFFFFFFLVYL
jgi:hypothetical protein